MNKGSDSYNSVEPVIGSPLSFSARAAEQYTDSRKHILGKSGVVFKPRLQPYAQKVRTDVFRGAV